MTIEDCEFVLWLSVIYLLASISPVSKQVRGANFRTISLLIMFYSYPVFSESLSILSHNSLGYLGCITVNWDAPKTYLIHPFIYNPKDPDVPRKGFPLYSYSRDGMFRPSILRIVGRKPGFLGNHRHYGIHNLLGCPTLGLTVNLSICDHTSFEWWRLKNWQTCEWYLIHLRLNISKKVEEFHHLDLNKIFSPQRQQQIFHIQYPCGTFKDDLFHLFFGGISSSWWFQPLWKILVKMGIFPK